ncbi:hypothetical protein F5146DRAFT_923995, partial [Armillaria mellea]
TVASISQFFLAMIAYPHVLKRAPVEIDGVVGKDRLPEFSDREFYLVVYVSPSIFPSHTQRYGSGRRHV